MSIEEITRDAVRLAKVQYAADSFFTDFGRPSTLLFDFHDGRSLVLRAVAATDELRWESALGDVQKLADLAELFPSMREAYGLNLRWCWEMRNHQGYFDALQIEFSDPSLAKTVIIQFKVAASGIDVFCVQQLSSTGESVQARSESR